MKRTVAFSLLASAALSLGVLAAAAPRVAASDRRARRTRSMAEVLGPRSRHGRGPAGPGRMRSADASRAAPVREVPPVGNGRVPAGRRRLREARGVRRPGAVGARVGVGEGPVAPYRFPFPVVSFALAPSTPAGAAEAPLVDAAAGRSADFDRLGARAKGGDRARALEPDDARSRTSSRNTWPRPRSCGRGATAARRRILFLSTRPRELLYRHTVTWGGRSAPIPMAQVAREDGLRLARLLETGQPTCACRSNPEEPDRRRLAGPERGRRDRGERKPGGDRPSRRPPGRLGPRDGSARQRRQLRPRRGGRHARSLGARRPGADGPLRPLHGRGNGAARAPAGTSAAHREELDRHVAVAHPRHRRRADRRATTTTGGRS